MEFPSTLMRLVDTPEFQRLRGVHQLGTAYFVYPGAVHTRFEHSLGTCWLTSQMLDRLQIEVSDHDRMATLAAALVHDVTHVPYGHTLEDEAYMAALTRVLTDGATLESAQDGDHLPGIGLKSRVMVLRKT